MASTSVIVIVLYFAGYGGVDHTLRGAMGDALAYLLGGAWAALLSLGLWPVDPFRPARMAVAECYRVLADFAGSVRTTAPDSEQREAARHRTHEFQRAMRLTMEAARGALETTAARSTARTVRARSLTVLLETADLLFAESIRWVELLEGASDSGAADMGAVELLDSFAWMSGAERVVERGLQQRPADGGASLAPEGSQSLQHVQRRADKLQQQSASMAELKAIVLGRLLPDERDALLNIEIAFEAVRSVWSGVEVRAGGAAERWEGLARRGGFERRECRVAGFDTGELDGPLADAAACAAHGSGGRSGRSFDAGGAFEPWDLAGDDVDYCAAAAWVGNDAEDAAAGGRDGRGSRGCGRAGGRDPLTRRESLS